MEGYRARETSVDGKRKNDWPIRRNTKKMGRGRANLSHLNGVPRLGVACGDTGPLKTCETGLVHRGRGPLGSSH